MKLSFFSFVILFFSYINYSAAQGCSDAGACTAGGMGDFGTDFNLADTAANVKKRNFKVFLIFKFIIIIF